MTTLAPRSSGPVRAAPELQGKARVTRPGDTAEREADRMADAALGGVSGRESDAMPAHSGAAPLAGTFMRQANHTVSELEEDDDYDIAAASRGSGSSSAPAGFLDQVRSSGTGHHLTVPVRDQMERGFGRSFDRVRVHTDAEAAQLADTIDARAFALGQDLFFAGGEFRPGTPDGDHLIAHELSHTIQQSGNHIARSPNKPRKKAKKAAPRSPDPARMTDEEKIKLRTDIHEEARSYVEDLRTVFESNPVIDPTKRASWVTLFDDALASAGTITDATQRSPRVAFLKGLRQLMDDDLFAFALTTDEFYFTGGPSSVARYGDPSRSDSAEALKHLEAEASVMRAGSDAYLTWVDERGQYRELGIDPRELATPESAEAEGAGGAGGGVATTPSTGGAIGGKTVEDRKMLEEMHAALADVEVEGETELTLADPDRMAEELRKLTAQQRLDFYAFLKALAASSKPEKAPKTMNDALDLFNHLDAAEREALALNREMAEAEPGAEEAALPEEVLLNVKADAEAAHQMGTQARTITSNLDLIRSLTTDPDLQKELHGFDFGDGAFFDEMAMLQGLLAGAGQKSELVENVGKELIIEIDHFREKIQREIAELAAEMVFWGGVAVLTQGAASPALLATIRRIKKLKDHIDTLRGIYRIYERVERVINIISGAGEAYERFRGWFENATATYAKLEASLESLESGEDVEEALEAQEEKLIEELDRQLDGRLGDLLEEMYIPEDTPPEELREILFNIPRGITALEQVWAFYRHGDSSQDTFTEVLAIKAFKAGLDLYPLVGLTAALAAEALQKSFPERTVEDRINRFISRKQRGPGLGTRNRNLFGRLNRKNYDYTDADPDLVKHLNRADVELRKRIDDDEPGSGTSEHWAPAWFKQTVRREIKEVNKEFKGTTVPAEHKTKKPGGGTTKVKENVALPPFKVRLTRPARGEKKLKAVIKINPEKTLEVDRLSNDDFAGPGLPYGGTPPPRQEAIRKYLRDAGYEVIKVPDGGGEHIRLPGGDQGSNQQPYLHIAGDKIKTGIDKAAYKRFLGTVVSDSRDLPEGYFAVHLKGEDTVSLKGRLAKEGHAKLGLDAGHKLIEGGGSAPPKVVAEPGIQKPDVLESFDYTGPVEAMFGPRPAGAPELNLQKKTQASWTKLVNAEPELKTRPRAAKGRLGYVVRARASGDALGSRHLPELQTNPADDKGHLIARRFGGVDDYANLVPMLRRQNQLPGRWYDMESDMAAVYVGKKATPGHYVEFALSIIYPSNRTRRPSKFVAKYQEKDATNNDKDVGTAKSRTVDND